MSHNPYEAPQTLNMVAAVSADFDQSTADVIRGARYCFYSTLAAVAITLIEFLALYFDLGEAWLWLQWLFLIISTVTGALGVYGIWLLKRVDVASDAKGLLLSSVIGLAIAMLIYWVMLGIAFLVQDFQWIIAGYFLSILFSYLSNIAMYLGMRRIGQYYQEPRVLRRATISLVLTLLLHGYGIYKLAQLILTSNLQEVFQHLAEERDLLARPLSFLLGIICVAFNLFTLRAIMMIRPRQFDELSDSQPTADQEASIFFPPSSPR